MLIPSLHWEDPLKEGMATHSSILAWRIPWTEEPGGLWSIGSQRVRRDWSDLIHTHACSLKGKLWQPRQCIKKQKHHFANKGLYSQSNGFSSSYIWMWELDHKKGWVPKNWCFRTVVLENTLESPLDCKSKQVNHNGYQSWIFIGTNYAEVEVPIFWQPDVKC